MGQIFVEGLGTVEIEGDVPNEKETQAIKRAAEKFKDESLLPQSEKVADTFLTGPKIGRLATEVVLSIGGTILTGGLGLPALAARGAILARPFLTRLAQSALGSGLGGATGAGVSQVFDPKDDIVREMVRGGLEGAVGEAIGAPVVIKGGQLLSKTFNRSGPKEFLKPFEDAVQAEEILFTGKAAQADAILANPEKYTNKFYDVNKVIEMATEAKKGLTPGMKTESRFLDTMENISTKSFFGAEELIGRKEALAFVGQTAQKDFIQNLTNNLNKTDLGTLFFDSLTGAKNARKAYFKGQYDGVDALIKEELGLRAGEAIPKLISGKPVLDSLNTYVKTLQLPPKDLLTLQKDIVGRLGNKRFDFKTLEGLRGEFISDAKDAFRKGDTKIGKAYDSARQGIDDLLDNPEMLKKYNIPTKAVESIKGIRKDYRETMPLFEDGILADILKKGNKDGGVDEIFNAIVKGKSKPELIKVTQDKIDTLVKKGYLDKAKAVELNDSLKGQYLANIFERSRLGDAAGSPLYKNFVDASKIADNLEGTRDAKEIYNLMFKTAGERKEIDTLLKNLAYSQGTIDKKTGLPGGVFIQLKQAGALGSALSYGAAGNLTGLLADKGLATILIAPAAFSKAMLNPRVNKFLFEETAKQNVGKISPAKSGILFRNLVGRLVDEGYVNSDEGLKAIEESKQVQSEFEKAGIKNTGDFNKKPVVQQPTPQMPAVNTRVTNLQTQAVAPQVAAPKPVASGITNIPQERIDQYTNLFGRI
jgi:polyhydroxyalkanoate synthesis regulator phasin